MAIARTAGDVNLLLRRARLRSLLLDQGTGPHPGITEVVNWFGAMQGQDLASLTWSLGLRTATTREQVGQALESGDIVRTWPMRGTLHVVPGKDARWMLQHLAIRSQTAAATRRTALGLTTRDAERATDVLGTALAGHRVLTRAQCLAQLAAVCIPSSGPAGYHLLNYASQQGVICLGPNQGKAQTFVLLDEFAPPGPQLDRCAALSTIAERFVRSHGPVSAQDLARWADLTLTDARAGLASADAVRTREFDGRAWYVGPAYDPALDAGDSGHVTADPRPPALALPGFDELVLGYRDRTAQLGREHEPLVVPGGNGVFAYTLVVGGRVVGTWRRRELTRTVQIEATPFAAVRALDRRHLDKALTAYGTHLGKPVEITWSPDVAPSSG